MTITTRQTTDQHHAGAAPLSQLRGGRPHPAPVRPHPRTDARRGLRPEVPEGRARHPSPRALPPCRSRCLARKPDVQLHLRIRGVSAMIDPTMTEPTYRHGTHLLADGGPYSITGRLLGDHDDLDGLVHMLTDDGECLALNGWMFTLRDPRHASPASTDSSSEPEPRLPFVSRPAPALQHARRRHRSAGRVLPSASNKPSAPASDRRVAFWQRPWYKRGTE